MFFVSKLNEQNFKLIFKNKTSQIIKIPGLCIYILYELKCLKELSIAKFGFSGMVTIIKCQQNQKAETRNAWMKYHTLPTTKPYMYRIMQMTHQHVTTKVVSCTDEHLKQIQEGQTQPSIFTIKNYITHLSSNNYDEYKLKLHKKPIYLKMDIFQFGWIDNVY